MKTTHMAYAILIFGIIVSITMPHLLKMFYATDNVTYETNKKNELSSATEKVNSSTSAITEASNLDVAIATPTVQEVKTETEKTTKTEEVEEQTNEEKETVEEIVYDGMTLEQLSYKLDKSLHSTLSGTGNLFAKYALQYGVDPYLSVAIVLQETGCKWSCSSAVKNYNNVGGMYSNGSLINFSSLEEGINAFMKNLKTKYYDKGLTTAELMNKKYASSTSWAVKVNNYVTSIKNS